MLKRKFRNTVVCISAAAMLFTASVSSAAPVVKLDTFNTAVLDTDNWNNIEASAKAVATDAVPSGYAVQNTGNGIWVSAPKTGSSLNLDFAENDYYISYYLRIEDTADSKVTTNSGTTNCQFGVYLFNGNTQLSKSVLVYNSTYGYRQCANIGSTTKYTDGNIGLSKGNTYKVTIRIRKGTTTNAIKCDVYDVTNGKLLDACTTEVTGDLSSVDTIKFGASSFGGLQTVSDFKIMEINAGNQNATNVYLDAEEVTFGDIPKEIAADTDKITIPEPKTGTKGSTVTYSSSDTSVIDNEGNVFHSLCDRNVFIKAEVRNGDVSSEVAYAVTVKGTGAQAMASEDFSGAGTALSADYIPTSGGFTGAWKTNPDTDTDSGAEIKEINSIAMAVMPATESFSQYNGIYNRMTTAIDMDADAVYYASWVWNLELPEGNTTRYAKTGFIKDGENTNEISAIWMIRYAEDKAPWLGMKLGTSNQWYGSASNDGNTINTGSMYNVLFKIKSSADSEDEISAKFWLAGTDEPADWTFTKTANLTGTYGRIFSNASTVAGCSGYIGDIKVEGYTGEDAETVENALAAAKSYLSEGSALETVEWPLENSIAEKSFNNICALDGKAYIKDIILTSDGTRITSMSSVGEGENVSVKVIAENDSSNINQFGNTVYAAVYGSDGILEKAVPGRLENPDMSEGTQDIAVNLGQVSSDSIIKIFVWNNELIPCIAPTAVISNMIKNY